MMQKYIEIFACMKNYMYRCIQKERYLDLCKTCRNM